MKLRQRAVLRTVRRWAEITFLDRDDYDCALCDLYDRCLNFTGASVVWEQWSCPYVEVFGHKCGEDFPELEEGSVPYDERPREKLCRAMALAKQYGLQREALAIVCEVVTEVRDA